MTNKTNQTNQTNRVYFPFLYKYYPILSVLSSSEIGDLFCLMVEISAGLPISRNADEKIKGLSDLILEDVNRFFSRNQPPQSPKPQVPRGQAPQYPRDGGRCGELDATAAFEAALRRTYGDALS